MYFDYSDPIVNLKKAIRLTVYSIEKIGIKDVDARNKAYDRLDRMRDRLEDLTKVS